MSRKKYKADEIIQILRTIEIDPVQVLIEKWREHYNTKWPHSSLGYKTLAPLSFNPNLVVNIV